MGTSPDLVCWWLWWAKVMDNTLIYMQETLNRRAEGKILDEYVGGDIWTETFEELNIGISVFMSAVDTARRIFCGADTAASAQVLRQRVWIQQDNITKVCTHTLTLK
jgi:hypothetical protein